MIIKLVSTTFCSQQYMIPFCFRTLDKQKVVLVRHRQQYMSSQPHHDQGVHDPLRHRHELPIIDSSSPHIQLLTAMHRVKKKKWENYLDWLGACRAAGAGEPGGAPDGVGRGWEVAAGETNFLGGRLG